MGAAHQIVRGYGIRVSAQGWVDWNDEDLLNLEDPIWTRRTPHGNRQQDHRQDNRLDPKPTDKDMDGVIFQVLYLCGSTPENVDRP